MVYRREFGDYWEVGFSREERVLFRMILKRRLSEEGVQLWTHGNGKIYEEFHQGKFLSG